MIEHTIERIAATLPAACPDGWLYDAKHYFCEHKAWTKATVFRREEHCCMLELKALVSEEVESLHELRRVLLEIWQNLAWQYFEASAFVSYKEAAVLRFITVNRNEKSYLAGRMIVGGNHYYELTRRWAGKFQHSEVIQDAPFEVNFADMDNGVLLLKESELLSKTADWAEDEVLIAELKKVIRKLDSYTASGNEGDVKSRDAALFNVSALVRITGRLKNSLHELSDWRQSARAVLNLDKPWLVDDEAVWNISRLTISKLPAIIERYGSKFETITLETTMPSDPAIENGHYG